MEEICLTKKESRKTNPARRDRENRKALTAGIRAGIKAASRATLAVNKGTRGAIANGFLRGGGSPLAATPVTLGNSGRI